MGPDARKATIEQIAAFHSSRDAFEAYQQTHWSEVRYDYEAFLRDAANERAAEWSVYYLAHPLLVNRSDVPSIFMDVELDLLFLDGEWLPREPAPDERDEETFAFLQTRRSVGFRLQPGRAAKQQLAKITEAGLSTAFTEDLVLINRLCNRNDKRDDPTVLGYPMWIIVGWDNYEGYLTGDELRHVARPHADGFLSVFAKVARLSVNEGTLTATILHRLAQLQEKAESLGPDTLCIAVSSV